MTGRQQIEIFLKTLEKRPVELKFSEAGTLSDILRKIVNNAKTNSVYISPDVTRLFVTSSIELWLRAVHSFLISISLTKSSPTWSSVSGYYSSHYTVRSFAHLLGHYSLFKFVKKNIKVEVHGGRYLCHILPKTSDGEHKHYWIKVKETEYFTDDNFFTKNNDLINPSDSGHRNWYNYLDHTNLFPIFSPLDINQVKTRIQDLSEIEFSEAPIPFLNGNNPDLDSVQLIAYHRLIKFKKIIDDIAGSNNLFWKTYKEPAWARGVMDYQVESPTFNLNVEDRI